MDAPLLHLITPSEWRAALATGAVTPPSLDDVGFVHLSSPEQVHLPANRLFGGRRDVLLLVLDPARLGAEVRWEPGVPGDPESMRFPHLYGPLPIAAVVGVDPYRPGAGGFGPATVGPVDDAWRSLLFEPSVLRRTATSEVAVAGGVAVLTEPVPASRFHNQVLFTEPVDVAVAEAEIERTLAGLPHRAALLVGPAQAATAAAFGERGWEVTALVHLAAPAAGTVDGRAQQVDLDDVRAFRTRRWHADLPDATAEEVRQLVERDALTSQVTDVRHLVRRAGDGQVVASLRLLLDGGTAWVDGLDTDGEHRRHGHGDALLAEAFGLAAAAGCDLVSLNADGDDWPLRWYERRGFVEVAREWTVVKPGLR